MTFKKFMTGLGMLTFVTLTPDGWAGQCGAVTKVTGEGQVVRNGVALPATVGLPLFKLTNSSVVKSARLAF